MSEQTLRRVVVTGLGAVSSLGLGVAAFVDGIRAGRSGIGPVHEFDSAGFEHTLAGEVSGFIPDDHLIRTDPARWGRAGQFAAGAARMAVADAAADPAGLARSRTVSCFGTTNGESQVMERIAAHLVRGGPEDVPTDLVGLADAGRIATAVAAELDLRGEAVTFGTACAAGNYAVGRAFDLLRSGAADAALCGGADVSNRATHAGFHRLGALARDVPRPFDRDRDGIVTAEGGVALLLEPLDTARARGARIYAEMLGYGMTCDARHMTNPDAGSVAACIRIAHDNSGVKPDDVDYICAHGTGTIANDVTEVSAIRDVFGERTPPVSSIKAMLGHTMGAAAGFGALVSCMAVHDGFLPSSPTLRNTDPAFVGDLDFVPGTTRRSRVRVAQNHGFGFGGNNAIALFGEVAA